MVGLRDLPIDTNTIRVGQCLSLDHCNLGMGWVNFSPLELGFGFFDYAWIGFRVFEFFLELRNFAFGFTLGPSFFLKHALKEVLDL